MMTPGFAMDRRQFVATLVAAACFPSAVLAKASGAATHPAMHALVDRYVAEKQVANMVVAIGGRQGPPDYVSAGQLDLGAGPSAGPDTLYRIYSMTKPITACAIMMLVEEGKLTLDTPLASIFPAYAKMNVLTDPEHSLATTPATKPILIRHLVTHSSGLAYISNAPAPLAQLYTEKGIDPGRAPNPARPPNLIAFAEAAAAMPLAFEPGSKWKYSIGLDVAGAVVEKLSGVPFDEFLQRRILTPLGMTDTSFTVPAAKLNRLAAIYQRDGAAIDLIETGSNSTYAQKPAFPSGGGGLVSSARDYSRFMAMLLNEGHLGGVRILKPETARLMMSNLMEPGVIATPTIGNTGYGAGGRSVIAATPGGEAVGTYGWSGAANSIAFVDRANGVYTVLMTQVMKWDVTPLYKDLDRALYGDLAHV